MSENLIKMPEKRSKEFTNRIIELYLWCILAMIISGRFWIASTVRRLNLQEAIEYYYLDILAAMLNG